MTGADFRRPWPRPGQPWSIFMRWYDLLFAHWPVPAENLRRLLPERLQIDQFDGSAWLAVVPFGMSCIRPHWGFPVPRLSAFLEINVRTYATLDGKPGVWFFSLDAANPLAVRTARRCFHLPYFDAHMSLHAEADQWLKYQSRRTHRGAATAAFTARYRPIGDVYYSQPGSFESWLTDRYCLYSADRQGRVYRGEIDHGPWPLQPAEAEIEINDMTGQIGLELPDVKPVLHFVRRLDVVSWRLTAT